MELESKSREQIERAYERMAQEADYHPAAPSDGYGNIIGEIDTPKEAREYAERWWAEENTGDFSIGSCDFQTRPATMFAVEAARLMCAGVMGDKPALALLRMAVADLGSLEGRDQT